MSGDCALELSYVDLLYGEIGRLKLEWNWLKKSRLVLP